MINQLEKCIVVVLFIINVVACSKDDSGNYSEDFLVLNNLLVNGTSHTGGCSHQLEIENILQRTGDLEFPTLKMK